MFDEEKIKETEEQLCSVIQKVDKALRVRDMRLKDIIDLVNDAGNQLERYSDDVIKLVIDLKKKTRTRLDSIRKELEAVISDQKFALNKKLFIAKQVHKISMCANLENNKSQQIACSSLAAMTSLACENVIKVVDRPAVKNISFQPHVTFQELLKTITKCNSLGEISVEYDSPLSDIISYKIVEKVKTCVKPRRDKEDCLIAGSCTLPDGTILLADSDNECLKSLSSEGTLVTGCLNHHCRPRSLAVINHNHVAVTFFDRNYLQIITIDRTLRITNTLKFGFECRGITHYNNELFISAKSRVYVYTKAHVFLRSFACDKKGEKLLSDIHSIAVSEDGSTLFVSDWSKGPIAIDTQTGRQLWRYAERDLGGATGVCADGSGGVFVSGINSFNVLHLSKTREKIGQIATRADGLTAPMSISFVKNTSKLLVTEDLSNEMVMFKLSTL